MSHPAFAVVGICPSELLFRYLFVCHSFDDIGPCNKHVALFFDHKDEIRQGGRITCTSRAWAENGGYLWNDSGGDGVLEKDVGISGQTVHTLLDAGSARIVQGDDGCSVFQGHRLHLDDLSCIGDTQWASEYSKIIGIYVNRTTIDLPIAWYDPISRDFVLLHIVMGTAMCDKFVEFDKGALIK